MASCADRERYAGGRRVGKGDRRCGKTDPSRNSSGRVVVGVGRGCSRAFMVGGCPAALYRLCSCVRGRERAANCSFGSFHAEAAEIGDAESIPAFRRSYSSRAPAGANSLGYSSYRGAISTAPMTAATLGEANTAPDIRFIGACDQPPDFDALHRAASRCGSEISPGNYRAPAMSFDRDQNCARGGSSLNLSYQLVDPSSAPLHARSGRLFRTSTATNDDALDVSDDQTTLADRVEPPATRPTRQ